LAYYKRAYTKILWSQTFPFKENVIFSIPNLKEKYDSEFDSKSINATCMAPFPNSIHAYPFLANLMGAKTPKRRWTKNYSRHIYRHGKLFPEKYVTEHV
ncbi:MAG: hypothetical protein QW821_03715, partial [Candidatus Bathyarchaeia archaeon]